MILLAAFACAVVIETICIAFWYALCKAGGLDPWKWH